MPEFSKFPMERERVLTSGNTTVGIIPDICLVSYFKVGDWPVLYRPVETGNVRRWGIPLMIPNFSRLKNGIFQEKGTTLPTHGFGRELPWTVTLQESDRLRMELQDNDTTRANYPYKFRFTSEIQVTEGTLTYTLSMENLNEETMPIAPGFHPYFTVAHKQKKNIVSDGPEGFKATNFDWDQQPPDQPFPFSHHVTIQFPNLGTLTISEQPQQGNYSLAMMQVWSEKIDKPDHEFVCFEPIVNSEDALNRPADRLNIPPHQTHTIVLQFHAQPL